VTPDGQFEHYNFQFNLQKCSFLKISTEHLGYIISPKGITLNSRHTEARLPPKKILEPQKFLGLTNYFRKFVKDCTSITKPLDLLLRNALNKVNINPRIAGWTRKIIHREGRRMAHVDVLSRIVAFAQAMSLKRELQYKQLQDPKFSDPSTKRENHHEFELLEGLSFRKARISLGLPRTQ